MNFLKKNIFYLIATAILIILFAFPEVKLKIKDLFFPVAAVENAVKLNDADYDIQLKGINTTSTNLKNLKGNKLVLLNFWGTWCPPCRAEFPTIQKLYDAKKDKVQFVLIAMQDEEAKVKEFLAENKYTTPVYLANSLIAEKMLPKSFPTTFLIAKNGRILMKEDAAKDWNSIDVQQFIDSVSK